MNKKGIFVPTLVFITLVVLTYAYFTFTSKEIESTRKEVIGEVQTKMIEQYREGENVLFYVDQVAKHSIYRSIISLGENGGFYTGSPCGKKEEYAIWGFMRRCNPVGNVESNLKNYLNKDLNSRLKKDLKRDYKFELNKLGDDLEITGETKNPIIIKNEEFSIEYSILPSFKHKINYDLGYYENIMNEVKEKRVCLIDSEDLDNCIVPDKFGLTWKIEKNGNFVKFDISKDSLFGKIVIRFAINLSDVGEEEEEINYAVLKGKVIAIDPSCEEKDFRTLNLEISKELFDLIRPYSDNVFLIREEDVDCKEEEERCNDANDRNAEIFISIQSTPSSGQKKIYYFAYEDGRPSKYGEKLAGFIRNELGFVMEGSSEKILLKKTKMPAVIVSFFEKDVDKKEVAEKILRGMVDYFEFKEEEVKYENEELILKGAKEVDKKIADYAKAIAEASAEFDIPVSLIKGVIATESSGRVCVESSAGAVGFMQIREIAVRDLNEKRIGDVEWKWEDVKDCSKGEINIKAGTAYLHLINRNYIKSLKLEDETESSLAINNAGYGTVQQAIEDCLGGGKTLCRTFDGYKEYLPKEETIEYVPRVKAFEAAFRMID